ncbi:MAG: hypothetical protein ACE5JO_08020 [Candidatus Binatia bacterium]
MFPTGTDFSQADRQAQLLDQYKLLVQTSEAVVARRQAVNTFFLSINSLLLGAIGVFASQGFSARLVAPGIVALGLTGILLCIAWRKLVNSHRQLNAGKFEIIHLLERHLPASIFKAEWEALGAGKDKKRYTPFTRTEVAIPWIFGSLYGLAVIGGVIAVVGIIQ